MLTIQDALKQAIERLTEANEKTARLDAQVLLGHVLQVERSFFYTYPERELTAAQEQQFLALVQRRSQGEPVAYLTGHKEFYGLDFLVDPRVLIPRPETELLVEIALDFCRHSLDAGYVPVVADIGTGSGVIPITLAAQEPRLPKIYASDISADALSVASLNCKLHHVEQRVHFLQGELVAPLPEPVDVITANLPYVGTAEMETLDRDVRLYEPHLALFSGPNGLDLLRRFLIETYQSGKLRTGGIMVLEFGYQQRKPLVSLVHEYWPQATITFRKDLAGWDRVLQVSV